MNKKEVTVKGTLKPQVVATIIEDILDSFKKGKVVVQNGHDFVTLLPSEQITIELEAQQKKGKEKLVLELSWEKRLEPSMPEGEFKISSEEPVIEEECDDEDEAVVLVSAAPAGMPEVAGAAQPDAKDMAEAKAANPGGTPAKAEDKPAADDKKTAAKGKK